MQLIHEHCSNLDMNIQHKYVHMVMYLYRVQYTQT